MDKPLLFGSAELKITQKFKPYIRCEICSWAEKRPQDPEEYIHCKKYPYMLSHKDATCKSSQTKVNN